MAGGGLQTTSRLAEIFVRDGFVSARAAADKAERRSGTATGSGLGSGKDSSLRGSCQSHLPIQNHCGGRVYPCPCFGCPRPAAHRARQRQRARARGKTARSVACNKASRPNKTNVGAGFIPALVPAAHTLPLIGHGNGNGLGLGKVGGHRKNLIHKQRLHLHRELR